MDVDAYLERIGHSGSREATRETLARLHRLHMFAVPFENLDIASGRRIVPLLVSFFDKIVRYRRGGFCYELVRLAARRAWLSSDDAFSLTSRRLAEFGLMCEYHQTSLSSHFTRNSVCSVATPTSRRTLSGRRAIETTASGRSERVVEVTRNIEAWFGVDLHRPSPTDHRPLTIAH